MPAWSHLAAHALGHAGLCLGGNSAEAAFHMGGHSAPARDERSRDRAYVRYRNSRPHSANFWIVIENPVRCVYESKEASLPPSESATSFRSRGGFLVRLQHALRRPGLGVTSLDISRLDSAGPQGRVLCSMRSWAHRCLRVGCCIPSHICTAMSLQLRGRAGSSNSGAVSRRGPVPVRSVASHIWATAPLFLGRGRRQGIRETMVSGGIATRSRQPIGWAVHEDPATP